jgi:hypothetical protein
MSWTIGKTGDRLVAAEEKIRIARIANRPAAFALRGGNQRAALRRIDRSKAGIGFVGEAGGRSKQPQETRLRVPRPPDAWRASTRRRCRGPPRPDAEAMDFADDCKTVRRRRSFGAARYAPQSRASWS